MNYLQHYLLALTHFCYFMFKLKKESNEFYLWEKNHTVNSRLNPYTQVVEKLFFEVASTACVDRSSPAF